MFNDYLLDKTFLLKLNAHPIKHYSAAIMILDYATEKPISRIEAKVIGGNLNVAASASVRRTLSLQLLFDETTSQIQNPNNLIAANKKIALSIGLNNPFYSTDATYRNYGDTIWFKQGVYLITKAAASVSSGAKTLSVDMIDKMGKLNGVCGGTLPANTSLHDRIIIDKDGNTTTEYPLISQIIKEVVHHFGGEDYSRIIVDDIPDVGRQVVRYVGATPINFATDDTQSPPVRLPGASFKIGSPPISNYMDSYYKGDDVGYMETDLTYPGEFIVKAGATVTQVLDTIVSTLGNFEYFYDIDGNFHFQQIRNYDKTGNTPLNTIAAYDSGLANLYLPKFVDDIYINEFIDNSLTISLSQSPNYQNIKNDFICWGSRNTTDSDNVLVRYHLAIDTRPTVVTKEDAERIGDTAYSLCFKEIWEVKEVVDGEVAGVIRYQARDENPDLNVGESWGALVAPPLDILFQHLDETYQFNWREELYRQALLAIGSATKATNYDEELIAEWRKLYDPTSLIDDWGDKIEGVGSLSFQQGWEDHYGKDNQFSPWHGYNVDVAKAPEKLAYWLDIIDSAAPIGKYSVNQIGRRSMVTENTKINEVFVKELNDIVFIPNTGDGAEMQKKAEYHIGIGQSYCFLTSEQLQYFETKNSFGTCLEEVRDMLYKSLIMNTSVSLSAIPILYLDVNKIIRLNLPELGIIGNYIISQISYTFGDVPTMSINASETVVII